MKLLAKPRKITIRDSNGQIYMFLWKPKDARLMDLNAIINKLLKGNSESRKRLHKSTLTGSCVVCSRLNDLQISGQDYGYGVVILNEECGFVKNNTDSQQVSWGEAHQELGTVLFRGSPYWLSLCSRQKWTERSRRSMDLNTGDVVHVDDVREKVLKHPKESRSGLLRP